MGFRNNLNPKHMEETADVGNIDYERIPHWNQTSHIHNMPKYIASGTIHIFWISGISPLVSLPNIPRVRELLTSPRLAVFCQDIFMTETAAIADVVLPAAQWGENTGCFTNVDRIMHLSRKDVDPPGEAKSDFKTFIVYAKRIDFKDKDDEPLLPWTDESQALEA